MNETVAKPSSSGSYLPESAETYFRWGIPSMVLAFITVALWLYSSLWVEPNLKANYRNYCDRELAELQLTPTHNSLFDSRTFIANLPKEDSFDELERRLKFLDLSIRRLVYWNKEDAVTRYQSAAVSIARSEHYRHQSKKLKKENQEEKSQLMSNASDSLSKASDSMRAVARMNREFALEARVWLASQKLDQVDTNLAALQELEKELISIPAPSGSFPELQLVIAATQLQLACFPGQLDDAARTQYAKRCAESVDSASHSDMEAAVSKALAAMFESVEEGKKLAQQALDANGVSITDDSQSVSQLASTFQALLLTGEVIEAQAFLGAWLSNPNWQDRDELIRAASKVCNHVFIASIHAGQSRLAEATFGIASQMNTAGSLLSFIADVSRADSPIEDRVAANLRGITPQSRERLGTVLLFFRSLSSESWEQLIPKLDERFLKQDRVNVLMIQAALMAADKGMLTNDRLYSWFNLLKDWEELPPEVLFQLVEILIEKGQPAHAAMLLESVKSRQPGHPKISALESRITQSLVTSPVDAPSN